MHQLVTCNDNSIHVCLGRMIISMIKPVSIDLDAIHSTLDVGLHSPLFVCIPVEKERMVSLDPPSLSHRSQAGAVHETQTGRGPRLQHNRPEPAAARTMSAFE